MGQGAQGRVAAVGQRRVPVAGFLGGQPQGGAGIPGFLDPDDNGGSCHGSLLGRGERPGGPALPGSRGAKHGRFKLLATG
jgi:hypothetical protein